jgi:hypothetical protein
MKEMDGTVLKSMNVAPRSMKCVLWHHHILLVNMITVTTTHFVPIPLAATIVLVMRVSMVMDSTVPISMSVLLALMNVTLMVTVPGVTTLTVDMNVTATTDTTVTDSAAQTPMSVPWIVVVTIADILASRSMTKVKNV